MQYILKTVEIEACKILTINYYLKSARNASVTLDNGLRVVINAERKINAGDYVNITDIENIFFMPAEDLEGPTAKYDPCIVIGYKGQM